MRRLEDGQQFQTENLEFASDGDLSDVDPSGPVIRVGGSVLLLLETQEDIKLLSDAAMNALVSSPSVEEQERLFLEILNQILSKPPVTPNPDQIAHFLRDALKTERDLTPLETLISGCEGLARLLEYPTLRTAVQKFATEVAG